LPGCARRGSEIERFGQIGVEARARCKILTAIGELREQKLLGAIDASRRLDLKFCLLNLVADCLLFAAGQLAGCAPLFLVLVSSLGRKIDHLFRAWTHGGLQGNDPAIA